MKIINYFKVVLLGILILGIPSIIQAAQRSEDSNIQAAGSFFHAQGADVGTLTGEATYGYFYTPNIEFGVIQAIGYSFIDGASDQWTGTTIPFVNYHFLGLTSNDYFQPFVGAFIGANYNKDDATGTIGPQIGFKTFMNDTTFLVVKYRYEWFFDDMQYNDISDSSDGNHVVTLGVGFLF